MREADEASKRRLGDEIQKVATADFLAKQAEAERCASGGLVAWVWWRRGGGLTATRAVGIEGRAGEPQSTLRPATSASGCREQWTYVTLKEKCAAACSGVALRLRRRLLLLLVCTGGFALQ